MSVTLGGQRASRGAANVDAEMSSGNDPLAAVARNDGPRSSVQGTGPLSSQVSEALDVIGEIP